MNMPVFRCRGCYGVGCPECKGTGQIEGRWIEEDVVDALKELGLPFDSSDVAYATKRIDQGLFLLEDLHNRAKMLRLLKESKDPSRKLAVGVVDLIESVVNGLEEQR